MTAVDGVAESERGRERLLKVLASLERKCAAVLQVGYPTQFPEQTVHFRHWQFARECLAYLRTHPDSLARFPDFMIIGTPRAASTWSKKIFQHTENVLFCLGEPRYFSKYFFGDAGYYLGLLEPETPANFQLDGRFRLNRRWIQGEKSPDYLCLPDRQIQLIKTLMPRLKPVLLVRDPVEACWSNLLFEFNRSDKKVKRPHTELSGDTEAFARTARAWRPLWSYASSLERWRRYYDEILFIFFEDIQRDPEGEAVRLFKHVGASYARFPDAQAISEKVNEAGTKFSWTEEQFRFLRDLFAEEYEQWARLFGRPPKY